MSDLWHFEEFPGLAKCGADELGQSTTTVPAHVTCKACWGVMLSGPCRTFAHGGDLGDLCYALPTIKALGGGDLVFYPDPRVREQFTIERAHNVGVFLAEQPYVRRWRFTGDMRNVRGIDYDFAKWRGEYDQFENLAYSQARSFGVDPAVADVPWLEVAAPARLARVVVMRSHRYRQRDFPWMGLANRYRNEAFVLGTRSEYEELHFQYGFTTHIDTATLSELARVIAGADIVITNQSCGYAIAEGLKKTVILERFPDCPNTDFKRPGVITGSEILDFIRADAPKTAPKAVSAPTIKGVQRGEAVLESIEQNTRQPAGV